MSRSAAFALCGVLLTLTLVSADPKPDTPEVPRKLLEERFATARSLYELALVRYQQGQAEQGHLLDWSKNWLEAELRLEPKQAQRVQSLRSHLDRVRNVEAIAQARFEAARGTQADVLAAKYDRLGAEIRLIEAGAIGKPPAVKREE